MNLLSTSINSLLANSTGSFWFPEANSSFAKNVDGLFYFILALDSFFFFLIITLMVYFMFKFKRTEGRISEPSPSHNTLLEITWTIIPSILVVIIFAIGSYGYTDMRSPPPDVEELRVTGKQWSWSIDYPNKYGSINSPDLHVTVGKPYKLVMTSDDVLHSFYIKDCRIKMDVVPGRFTYLWFDTLKPGVSDIFCAEYCGKDHSIMRSKLYIHPVEPSSKTDPSVEEMNLDQWMVVESNPLINKAFQVGEKYDPYLYGKKLYESRGCKGCHSTTDAKSTGPSFLGNWGTVRKFTDGTEAAMDDNYVIESILNPNKKKRVEFANGVMPSFSGQLKTKPDIDALIIFLNNIDRYNEENKKK